MYVVTCQAWKIGCLAYVHVVKEQISKLDSKSRSCSFLGYGEVQFGYKQWGLIDKKVIRIRDIECQFLPYSE